MNENVQRRTLHHPAHRVQLRDNPPGGGALPTIVGYASVFYRAADPSTEYEMWPADAYGPRMVERIMPRAFDRAIREDDVRGLFDHQSGFVLGRNTAGTLRLFVDAVGLRYEIDPPDTQQARDLLTSIRRGDISGSSFAFIPRDTSRREVAPDAERGVAGEYVLERNDVQLFDVGPVTYPAYAGATSGVRASGRDLDAVRAEVANARGAAWSDQLAVTLALLQMEESESE